MKLIPTKSYTKLSWSLIMSLLALCGAHLAGQAQVTWSGQVASIIYTNCTPCHRPGEIGPMPFTSYQEASAYASMIAFTTQARSMPPWQANPNYSQLLGERVLSTQEIQTISDWVQQGALRGNPAQEPPLPQFPSGSQLGLPDTVISMAQSCAPGQQPRHVSGVCAAHQFRAGPEDKSHRI